MSDVPYGLRDAVPLLGQQVRVTLSREENVIAAGKLLRISMMGEFVLEDEMGDIHYCWPMLDIEPLSDSNASSSNTAQGSLISGSGVSAKRQAPFNEFTIWGEYSDVVITHAPCGSRHTFRHRSAITGQDLNDWMEEHDCRDS